MQVIYDRGYVDLGIVTGPASYTDFIGALVYRHADEWVMLVPAKLLKKAMEKI